jgi:hypothetical protein
MADCVNDDLAFILCEQNAPIADPQPEPFDASERPYVVGL